MPLALAQMEAALRAGLPATVVDYVRIRNTVHGLVVEIERPGLLTQISVWPSGECDVDLMHIPGSRGEFRHFQFTELAEAVAVVSREVHSALGTKC